MAKFSSVASLVHFISLSPTMMESIDGCSPVPRTWGLLSIAFGGFYFLAFFSSLIRSLR